MKNCAQAKSVYSHLRRLEMDLKVRTLTPRGRENIEKQIEELKSKIRSGYIY